jgi:hypothetical protein
MTPKKKAEQLLEKFNLPTGLMSVERKQCALIAVDEIINQCWGYRDIDVQKSFDYWQEVKQEIEKL